MNTGNDIYNELQSISPLLAGLDKVNVFSVPGDYFNNFPGMAIAKVNETALVNADFILSQKILNPLSVPQGYFDNLSNQVLGAIKMNELEDVEELKVIAPALAAITRENVFSVPGGYFDQLAGNIQDQLPKPAKVISMRRPAFIKYAVAAVITGLMGLSLFSTLNNPDVNVSTYSAQVMDKASSILSNNSFENELQVLDRQDIEQYLKQSGQDVEAALVASVTDDANLPSEDEYLFNQDALDDFLKSLNLNN